MALFIKRQERPSLIKDFLASKRAERQWSRHRFKMLKGVRNWHESTQGKLCHRQLGRYLALRQPARMPKQGLFIPRD